MEYRPSATTNTHLLILALITTLFLSIANESSDAKLILDRSDHQAVLSVQRGLGINQSQTRRQPCTSSSVFCERRLSGSVPLLRVTRLRFQSMGLRGFLSPAIGKLTELKELSLPDNSLADRIPPEIVECRKLETLNLRNNLFSGSVTPQLSLLTMLRELDLSSNELSGNLTFLKHFLNLEHLSLSHNRFSGAVPDSVWNFPHLLHFDVSGNPLVTGRIPDIRSLPSVSDVARRSVLAEGPTSSFGNGEYPAPSPEPRSPNYKAPDSADAPSPTAEAGKVEKTKKKKMKGNKVGMIIGFVGGVIAGGISGFVISVLVKMLLKMIKGEKKSGLSIFSPNAIKRQDLAFLEQEDGLAALHIIGKGGCGEVYKTELPGRNGMVLAIKKILQPPLNASELTEEDTKMLGKKMRQIRSEILTVGKIRHRNLLPLLAHLARPDCHYLVYEFMKNGSLQDMLEDVKQGKRELGWPARFRIAMGVAHGLEYLHFEQHPMIIHRDMKPGNILLDDDMEAKIGDFGLAKTMPDANTHMTSSNVAGTLGYIAPEYHQTLKFTDKCDIYSFGVVLGVLVMGKLPSDEFFQNTCEMSLVGWMRNVMTSANPNRAIDPNLLGNGFEDDMLLVLKIACFCTLEDPKQRPDSKNVRLMLAQIITKH
uniref:Protein kinase domain-containing protein n=1 Tax=Kalanchoe fedtschenkoi TaxID=63787 RepID=A0A7N0TJR3_KALFE